MQITLKQAEVEIAIRNYVRNMGIVRNIENMQFTTTRQPPGVQVEIQLDEPKATHALASVEHEPSFASATVSSGTIVLTDTVASKVSVFPKPIHEAAPVEVYESAAKESVTEVTSADDYSRFPDAVVETVTEAESEVVVAPITRKRTSDKSLFA